MKSVTKRILRDAIARDLKQLATVIAAECIDDLPYATLIVAMEQAVDLHAIAINRNDDVMADGLGDLVDTIEDAIGCQSAH